MAPHATAEVKASIIDKLQVPHPVLHTVDSAKGSFGGEVPLVQNRAGGTSNGAPAISPRSASTSMPPQRDPVGRSRGAEAGPRSMWKSSPGCRTACAQYSSVAEESEEESEPHVSEDERYAPQTMLE